MEKIKIIIIDADGTIFDSMPGYAKIFSDLLFERYNIPKKESNHFLISTAGTAIEQQIQQMLEKYNFKNENIMKLGHEFYELARNENLKFFPDVIPALKKLKGFRKFLSSGNQQDLLNMRVKQYNLKNYFEEWLGFGKNYGKSEHIEYLIKKLNLTKEEFAKMTIYVADASTDMKIAKSYNITSFGRIGTLTKKELLEAGASFAVKDFDEIVQYLE